MQLHYRKMALCWLAAMMLLACAGCGGSTTGSALGTNETWPAHDFDGGVRSGSFVAVAVDSSEAALDPLTANLRLSVREVGQLTRVTISASGSAPRAEAFVHLGYDSLAMQPVATRAGQNEGAHTLFLGVTTQPRAVALGMVTVGLEESLSGDFVIGEVDFAPGARIDRSVSVLNSNNSLVTDLTLVGTQEDNLQWYYRNVGDYNKDSLVGIADLTPLGANFGDSVPLVGNSPNKDSAPYPADGNGDNLVNIQDITPIGANFQNTVNQYVIKSSLAQGGPFNPTGQVAPLSSGVGPTGQLKFTVPIVNPVAQTYYVVVPANAGEEGPASNAVLFNDGPPPPPVLNPPTNVQVAENAGQLTVSWQAPLTGEVPTGYNLYYADTAESFGLGTATLHPSSPIAGLSINLNAVEFPTTVDRYFALKSVNDSDEGANFSNIAFWDGGEPPAGCPAPLNLTATSNGTNIVLEWDPPADPTNVNTYFVSWCTGDPDEQTTLCSPLTVTAGTSYEVTDEDIRPENAHWFSLRSMCTEGQSVKVNIRYLP